MSIFTLIEHGNYLYSAASRIAEQFRTEGDWQKAAQLYEAALLVDADAVQMLQVQIGLSELLIKWANFDRAQTLLLQAQRTATEEDELSQRGMTLYWLGDAHYYRQMLRGDSSHTIALDYHQQAHDLRLAIGDAEHLAQSMWRIGTIKEAQAQKQEASEWYHKAIAQAETSNYEAGKRAPLSHLAMHKRESGDMDGARKDFEEALMIAQKSTNIEAVAFSSLNLGRHLFLMGQDLELALDYMHKARVLAAQLGYIWIIWAAYTRIADFHAAENKISEARIHYHQALGIARRHDLFALEKESAGALQIL